MVDEIFQQRDQAETIDATEVGGQTETTKIDAMGTSSALPQVQSLLPKLRGMSLGYIMILQSCGLRLWRD